MDTLVEIIQQRGIEAIGRYYSTYRGIVVEDVDPDKTNKICVYLPTIQAGVVVWAYPKGQAGGPNSGFKWLTPKKNSIVYVQFENGDPRHPLWTYHGWAIGETPDDLVPNGSLGFITPKGNKIVLDETEDGKLTIKINGEVNMDFSTFNLQKGEVGIPESTPLVQKINAIEQEINKLKQLFKSWTPVPKDGGSALKAILQSFGQEISETKVEDIASKTIKQNQ